jgi:ethanolamine utilization protein EutA (predicted chaperonin)
MKFRNITFTPFIVFVSPNINISSYTTKVILSELQFSNKIVNFHWKPSKMIEVDFKIAHHSIFTNTKLMKMKLIDYENINISSYTTKVILSELQFSNKISIFS